MIVASVLGALTPPDVNLTHSETAGWIFSVTAAESRLTSTLPTDCDLCRVQSARQVATASRPWARSRTGSRYSAARVPNAIALFWPGSDM
jgi:hypothetical protein